MLSSAATLFRRGRTPRLEHLGIGGAGGREIGDHVHLRARFGGTSLERRDRCRQLAELLAIRLRQRRIELGRGDAERRLRGAERTAAHGA